MKANELAEISEVERLRGIVEKVVQSQEPVQGFTDLGYCKFGCETEEGYPEHASDYPYRLAIEYIAEAK